MDRSNGSMMMVIIFAAVLVAVLAAFLIAGGPRSDFDQQVQAADIAKALTSKGLSICSKEDIFWNATPGFVSGKIYDVSTNCSSYDPNKPGARLWVVKFENLQSREAAMRNFETNRRHIGSGISWSIGPLVILTDGSQKDEVVLVLKEAIASTGAK